MALFPDGNDPDSAVADSVNWPDDAGHDLVFWARNNGSEDAADPEYPEWDVFDDSSLYAYDEQIRMVWDSSSSLRQTYPDGHYRADSTLGDMIDWARSTGYAVYEDLHGYSNWPYIGSPDTIQTFGILKVKSGDLPLSYALYHNFPNPFNPQTTIKYDLPEDSRVILKLYNLLGEEVMTLVDREEKAGRHQFVLTASALSSGVYFYRLRAEGFTGTEKLLLLK